MLKKYLWILPFLSFLLGYQFLSTLTTVHELKVPPLVGLSVTEAVKVLSDNNLNARIMAEKEEPDLRRLWEESLSPGCKIGSESKQLVIGIVHLL